MSKETIESTLVDGVRDSRHCMIADALKASYPDAKSISVDLATIRFTDTEKGLRYTYLTPRVAQVELVKFDQGLKPAPFTFRLRNAHVTRSGQAKSRRAELTEEQKGTRKQRAVIARENLKKARVVSRGNDERVPDRVGGVPPPLQLTDKKVPFSRRRAFGLRALEY